MKGTAKSIAEPCNNLVVGRHECLALVLECFPCDGKGKEDLGELKPMLLGSYGSELEGLWRGIKEMISVFLYNIKAAMPKGIDPETKFVKDYRFTGVFVVSVKRDVAFLPYFEEDVKHGRRDNRT